MGPARLPVQKGVFWRGVLPSYTYSELDRTVILSNAGLGTERNAHTIGIQNDANEKGDMLYPANVLNADEADPTGNVQKVERRRYVIDRFLAARLFGGCVD